MMHITLLFSIIVRYPPMFRQLEMKLQSPTLLGRRRSAGGFHMILTTHKVRDGAGEGAGAGDGNRLSAAWEVEGDPGERESSTDMWG